MTQAVPKSLTMDFVVFPTQALRDPDPSPFRFCQQTENPRIIGAEKVLGNHF